MLGFLNGIGRVSSSEVGLKPIDVIQQMAFTRTSTQTYTDNNNIIQTAAINEPARDKRGFAVFEDRKNFHPYSENLSSWDGNIGNTRTLTSEVAPDGSTDSVYRYNRTVTTTSFSRRGGMTKDNANAEQLTHSMYIKDGDCKDAFGRYLYRYSRCG